MKCKFFSCQFILLTSKIINHPPITTPKTSSKYLCLGDIYDYFKATTPKSTFFRRVGCYSFTFLPHHTFKPYRPIRTHQERAMHELHKKEYRQIRQLKLRARRGKTLPCAWHDINVSAHAYTKSWKHNSKRRKQWYRTNDI